MENATTDTRRHGEKCHGEMRERDSGRKRERNQVMEIAEVALSPRKHRRPSERIAEQARHGIARRVL